MATCTSATSSKARTPVGLEKEACQAPPPVSVVPAGPSCSSLEKQARAEKSVAGAPSPRETELQAILKRGPTKAQGTAACAAAKKSQVALVRQGICAAEAGEQVKAASKKERFAGFDSNALAAQAEAQHHQDIYLDVDFQAMVATNKRDGAAGEGMQHAVVQNLFKAAQARTQRVLDLEQQVCNAKRKG